MNWRWSGRLSQKSIVERSGPADSTRGAVLLCAVRAWRSSVHAYPPTSKTEVTPLQRQERKNRSGRACSSASTWSYGYCSRRSRASGRPSTQPVCEKCTCVSTRPGMIHFPAALTVSASGGTGQAARGPAQATRPSCITTTALRTGAAPVPSTRVAPMNAVGGGAPPLPPGGRAPDPAPAPAARAAARVHDAVAVHAVGDIRRDRNDAQVRRNQRVRPAVARAAGEVVVTLPQAVGPDARELAGVEIVREVGRAVARVDGRDVAAERFHGCALDRDRKAQGGEQRRESGEVHAH